LNKEKRMNVERLELAYTIEPLRTELDEVVAAVWLTVERFTCQGPTGAVTKQPVSRLEALFQGAAVARLAFQSTLGFLGDRHPSESGLLESHLREALIPVARVLTGMLIPDALGTEIQSAEAPLVIEFRVDPVLNQVPWELLFLGRDFLSFSHATGRQVLSRSGRTVTPRPQGSGDLRSAYIVDPCPIGEDRLSESLVKAAKDVWGRWEADAGDNRIRFAREGTKISESVSGERLTRLLRGHDLVLVLGHHADRSRAPKQAPHLEGLLITDDQGMAPALYPPVAMLSALQPPNVPPELLFWLACESGLATGWGEDWPNDKRIYGFVDAAVRAGVTHFIGSSIPVPEAAAADLVEPFLLGLAMGCSVGEALRRARVAARSGEVDPASGGSLVGLAFSLFGRPSMGLLNAAGKRIGGQLAHPCLHVEDGVRCGQLHLPGEAGAGNQRCAVHSLIPPPPGPPREPCGNPYGKHVDAAVWVTALDDGWDGAIRAKGTATPRFLRLCKACREEALAKRELVRLEDLLP
jgi:hypothetical protein